MGGKGETAGNVEHWTRQIQTPCATGDEQNQSIIAACESPTTRLSEYLVLPLQPIVESPSKMHCEAKKKNVYTILPKRNRNQNKHGLNGFLSGQ